MNSSFWKSGHTPTLFAAFLYFDLSFMVWYLLGPLAVQIAADLHLTTQQRGLVVATPILAGAVLRFIMGMLAELQAMGTSREKLQQLIEMVATWESQQDPDIDFDEQDRRRENAIKTFSKMLTLDVRADTAKKLVDSMVKIVDLERRVYGIKDDTGETDTVRALKELING